MKRSVFISDTYKKVRGGYSRLLQISCEKCGAKICMYQKDGPGLLKRMYVDRMIVPKVSMTNKMLACPECHEALGVSTIYKKENRPAFRLFVGSVTKKVVNSNKIRTTDW